MNAKELRSRTEEFLCAQDIERHVEDIKARLDAAAVFAADHGKWEVFIVVDDVPVNEEVIDALHKHYTSPEQGFELDLSVLSDNKDKDVLSFFRLGLCLRWPRKLHEVTLYETVEDTSIGAVEARASETKLAEEAVAAAAAGTSAEVPAGGEPEPPKAA